MLKFLKRQMMFFMASVLFATPATAANPTQYTPHQHLEAALQLWRLVSNSDEYHIFNSILFVPVTGQNAPLARYAPKNTGQIEIGGNLRQYRREYVILSSNQDMSTKPDFDQYMTVMIILSLANESAHYFQDKNGSLKDFQAFYQHNKKAEACALYSLQQYASDVVMMEFAIRLERFFLGKGSVKGINALRIALEKNNLRDEFEIFREGLNNRDLNKINHILHVIRAKRNKANMQGLEFCDKSGDALLDQSIINRAIEHAKENLSAYTISMNSPEALGNKKIFNQ